MTEYSELQNALRDGDEVETSSWRRIDMRAVVSGKWEPIRPELMKRTDGHGLLYRGMVHTFQGESESGKSMLAQAEAARVLQAGGSVLYLDFESDEGTVGRRLLALGADPDTIVERFDYRRPDEDPAFGNALAALDWEAITKTRYALAVIDGVTEAFTVWGVGSMDNDEVTTWGRRVPKALAVKTGAAVVLIDHVTKSKDGRGRFAIGAQAKMSYLTGASYLVEPVSPLIKGQEAVLSIRVGKDRPGGVRPVSADYREGDRTQEAARAVFDSHGDTDIDYRLNPPAAGASTWEPTGYMEKVSRWMEARQGQPASSSAIEKGVGGKAGRIREAVERLEVHGHLARTGTGRKPWTLIRPYREGSQEAELDNLLT